MQKPKLPFFIFFVIIFAMGCTPPTEAVLMPSVSRELDIIEHGRNENSLAQLLGTADLLSGDSLFVHSGGSGRLEFGDKMRIRLFNDTRLNEIRAESIGDTPLEVDMFLAEGGLTGRLVDVGGRTTIKTPNNARIDIFGTDFFVIFDPANDIAAAGNFGGTVEVTKAGQTLPLESGSFVIMAGRNPPSNPRPIGESMEEFEQRSIELLSPLTAFDELVCVDGLAFVGDLSIPQGTVLQPGEPFMKSWQVRNTGSCSWDQSYTLQFFGGSAMSGNTPNHMDTVVSPDENKTLTVAMVAPMVAGTYYGMWQLIGPQGEVIGRPLEVEIVVPQGSTAIVSSPTTLPPATKIPTIPPSPTRLLPATKIPTIPPSPTPLVPHTFTPIPPVTEEPCARPSTVTTIVNGTVRNGPGSYYEVLYTMESGQTAVVTGRYSGTAYWWRIDDPYLYGDQLWVANTQVSFEGNITCVPEVTIPPTPTPPPSPTPTPTPSPTPSPLPTPIVKLPPEFIPVDARCTTCQELIWETAHINALYLNSEPVPLSSRRNVCLTTSDLYDLQSGYQSQIVYPYLFGVDAPGWNFDQMTQVYWSMPDLWLNAYETEIEAGACTSLDWKAENAVAVTLDGEPVANEGQIRVCPAETRSYLLSADIGCTSEQRTVTVRVRYPVPQVEYAIWGFDGVDIDESEIQIYVSYSYETNNTEPIYISARVLGYGQILDYFYIDPVKIYPGSDQVNMSLIYGYNDPPDVILSDQIEIYMFWGTEELHSERFDYQKRWKSFIVK